MLRNNAIHDSLDPNYDEPFEVFDRKGPNIKLHVRRQWKNRTGRQNAKHSCKWVHSIGVKNISVQWL